MAGLSEASDANISASAATLSHGGEIGRASGRSTRTRDLAVIDNSRCGVSIRRLNTVLPKASVRLVGGRQEGDVLRLNRSSDWPSADTGVSRRMPFVNSTVAPYV